MMSKIKDWFVIQKLKNRVVFGFGNSFFRVIKNTKNNKYSYMFYDSFYQGYRILKKGNKSKFFNKYSLSAISILYNIIINPIVFIGALIIYYPLAYFDGMKNFIHNGFWANNVRLFNWVNFVCMVVLGFLLIIKMYLYK